MITIQLIKCMLWDTDIILRQQCTILIIIDIYMYADALSDKSHPSN